MAKVGLAKSPAKKPRSSCFKNRTQSVLLRKDALAGGEGA